MGKLFYISSKDRMMSQVLFAIHYLPFQEKMSKDPSSVYKGHVHIFPEVETTLIKS